MTLIFFDLDGVLTPKPHSLQVAEMVGREDELYEIFENVSSGTNGKVWLEWLVEEMVKMFADIHESILEDAGKKLPIMKGAVETIKELKRAGYNPILVTNGIEQVARTFARRLGITEWYANTLEIKDGKTTGRLRFSPLLTLQSKGDLVRRMMAHTSLKKGSVAVGNDANDWPMFQEAELSILFNPPPDLEDRLKWYMNTEEKEFREKFTEFLRCVDVVIKEPNLQLLLPYVVPESFSSPKDSKSRN